MKSIYIAGASAEIDDIESKISIVKKAGYLITFDWTEKVREVGNASPDDPNIRREAALADLRGVERAEIFWLLKPTNASTGAWVELGAALMLRKYRPGKYPVIVVSGVSKKCIFADLPPENLPTRIFWTIPKLSNGFSNSSVEPMKVRLESAGDVAVRFRLASGSQADFRRVLAPFAGKLAAGLTMLVPLASSRLACATLSKSGVQLVADPKLQAAVLAAAWKCPLGGELFPYQRLGSEFLRSRKRAILADQMGLGKSASALTAIDASKPTVVISPPVVLGSWYDECRRWRPDLRAAIWRRPYPVVPGPGEISIASYSMLPMEFVEARTRCPFCGRLAVIETEPEESVSVSVPASASIREGVKKWAHLCARDRGGCGKMFDQREDAFVEHAWCGPKSKGPVQLVVDEAHYCKSRKTKRSLFVRALATQCESTWLLTGTPLLNTPEELWSLCQIFPGPGRFATGAHDAFDSWPRFVELFHGKKKRNTAATNGRARGMSHRKLYQG